VQYLSAGGQYGFREHIEQIEIGIILSSGNEPEQQELSRLIGTLAEEHVVQAMLGARASRNRGREVSVLFRMKPRGRILHQPVILLVEDEALFRTLEVEVLREAGFWVLEAQDADEAFECLKRREDIKAVLTDVSMPGSVNGFEFARLVAQGWPEVGVLVISGRALPKEGDLPPSAVFVPKPIRPDALVEMVRSLVARIGAKSTS
jgi:CheY-like chemotaxis protein